jgi:group II intron reverse transcriptase/maturase
MKSVEELRSSLYLAAKADRIRRFYTLKDKICRIDVITEAWKRVRQNKGGKGVDSQTIEEIEASGTEQFISSIQKELQNETYRVQCVRRVFIPKSNGKSRPLGIPTVKDRVVQQAVRLIIEPIFEADFHPFNYGYRPNKSAKDASMEVYKWLNFGLTSVLDIDIEDFFGTIVHEKLISFVTERIADGYVIKLIREWLRAGVVYLDKTTYPEEGTPQGGVISPLLANVYLNRLDAWWDGELRMNDCHRQDAQLVRYADDMVVLTSHEVDDAEHYMGILEGLLEELGLKLNREKSRVIAAKEGFDFLGFHYMRRYYTGKGKESTVFFPSQRAAEKFREKVRTITSKSTVHLKDEKQLARELNSLIRGWTNYFNHSNASETYKHLQRFVLWKFCKFICFKYHYRMPAYKYGGLLEPYKFGLIRLTGRIFYLK